MEAYFCKCCNYYTENEWSFRKHLNTEKHGLNASTDVNQYRDNEDVSDFKHKLYICPTCDNVYMSNRSLQSHMAKSHTENDILKHKIVELECKLEEERQERKEDKQLLGKALDIAQVNSKTANASMNMLKYAQTYLNDAEPLEELTGKDVLEAIKYKNPKGLEPKNETYVKIAIHKFTHNIFANFVGDMIIEHYQPKTKSEANVIATDTSRLCFIVMQKITKKDKNKTEQKEWINDKSGKKFTELVLRPIINAVKETLVEFIEFKKKKELNDSLIFLMGKCIELKRDIEVDKFTKPILRYVAPSFHFDKLKILEDDIPIVSDDGSLFDDLSDSDCRPVKIKTKKKKPNN